MGSSLNDIVNFPEEVRREIGFGIHLAQNGGRALNATPLVGFCGTGVVEIVSNHIGSTFRCVYAVKLADAVYVLHAFQKKSVKGIETPKKELDLVRKRLADAEDHYKKQRKIVKEVGR